MGSVISPRKSKDFPCGNLAGLMRMRLPLALLVMGGADPVLADDEGDGLGSADHIFERRDPSEARTRRTAFEESCEALGGQPAVQLRSGGPVAVGVAQEDIVAGAAPHGASLFHMARQSIPLIRLEAGAAPRFGLRGESRIAWLTPPGSWRACPRDR
jgi:hypothetical protein